MILIITNKLDYTADYLILELNKLGIDYIRFNTEDFPAQVGVSLSANMLKSGGYIQIGDRKIQLETINSVWFRRPVNPRRAAEIIDVGIREFMASETTDTLSVLWHAISSLWVNHPDQIRIARLKFFQLQRAIQLGFQIPETLLTNIPSDANVFIDTANTIYKTQSLGKIEHQDGVGLIYTSIVKPEHQTALDQLKLAPGLFQRYIPKLVELRVTVVGRQVFAATLNSQQVLGAEIDWRRVELDDLHYEPYELPSNVEEQCVALVENLGLKFGAIDLIVTPEREYVFLEINPSGQWVWIEQLCPELRIRDALIHLLSTGKSLS
jgi:glutathione synthase/RimK-type ligase-like ATP-grasp enzyme